MTYYVAGGSVYDSASYKVYVYGDHGGYPDGDYGTRTDADMVDDDPYWRIGGTGGQQVAEIGLHNKHRIKITSTGVYKWQGPGVDDFVVIATSSMSDVAYDSTSWNTNSDGATKNVIRDLMEDKVFEASSSFPGTPFNGQLHWDEDDEAWYRYSSTAQAWIQIGGGGGGAISNIAFAPSWEDVEDIAPSKNAVYDKFVLVDAEIAAKKAKAELQIRLWTGASWYVDTKGVLVSTHSTGHGISVWFYIDNCIDATKDMVFTFTFTAVNDDDAIAFLIYAGCKTTNNTEPWNSWNLYNGVPADLDSTGVRMVGKVEITVAAADINNEDLIQILMYHNDGVPFWFLNASCEYCLK